MQETRFEIATGDRRLTRGSDPGERKVNMRELLWMYHRRSRPARDVGHDSIPVSRRRGFSDLRAQNSVCDSQRASENAKKKRCAFFHGDPRPTAQMVLRAGLNRWRYCATPEIGTSGAFETSIAAGTIAYFTTNRAL
jgi:hypothetical protein